jgi:hypothetical protein
VRVNSIPTGFLISDVRDRHVAEPQNERGVVARVTSYFGEVSVWTPQQPEWAEPRAALIRTFESVMAGRGFRSEKIRAFLDDPATIVATALVVNEAEHEAIEARGWNIVVRAAVVDGWTVVVAVPADCEPRVLLVHTLGHVVQAEG